MNDAWSGARVMIAAGPRFWEDPAELLWLGAVTSGLLLGALAIAWVTRWRKKLTTESRSASDQLLTFRSLYEQGELSREEYERIRSRLGQQLRKEWQVPPPIADQAAPPENPTPPTADGK